MTDKEFKRLTRAQLFDVIYQLQLQADELTQQKKELAEALEDKRLRISNAGNLAEAVLEINDLFRNAQTAAAQYINELKTMHAEAQAECQQLLAEAKAQAEEILNQARAEAEAITAEAKRSRGDYEAAVDAIMKEYGQEPTDNG